MIYIRHYTKNKDNFFTENNKQQGLNRKIEASLEKESTMVG